MHQLVSLIIWAFQNRNGDPCNFAWEGRTNFRSTFEESMFSTSPYRDDIHGCQRKVSKAFDRVLHFQSDLAHSYTVSQILKIHDKVLDEVRVVKRAQQFSVLDTGVASPN